MSEEPIPVDDQKTADSVDVKQEKTEEDSCTVSDSLWAAVRTWGTTVQLVVALLQVDVITDDVSAPSTPSLLIPPESLPALSAPVASEKSEKGDVTIQNESSNQVRQTYTNYDMY